MSQETFEWLNSMTLIGFTEKRGNAWHYKAELQGDEPNHYVGAVPVEDVLRRLFNFEVRETSLYVPTGAASGAKFKVVPGRKAMTTSDTGDLLGIFKDGYQGHRYKEWPVGGART